MNTSILIGTIIVNIALVSYTIAVFKERKSRSLSKGVMIFLTLGVLLDITATIFMVVGSSKSGFTLHWGIVYSSLTGMLLDTYFSYRKVAKEGLGVKLSNSFVRNTTFVYAYWVAGYTTGGLLVLLRWLLFVGNM